MTRSPYYWLIIWDYIIPAYHLPAATASKVQTSFHVAVPAFLRVMPRICECVQSS